MTAKQYLYRVRRVDKEITALISLADRTRDSLERITQNYDGDGAQSTKDPHKFDRLAELEDLIDQKIDEQLKLKAETLNTIMQLDNRLHREVLIGHYLNMKTWEQVAVDMDYSWRQIMNFHGSALQEIQRIIG